MNDSLPPMRPTPPGLYRHYKGLLYEVVGMARHSETLEALTLYRALYGAHELWVRPAAMFEEQVVIDGRAMPRFERCEGQPDVSADLKGPLQTG
ncbi:MAG: DUF1653 domain-containing protein [Comamonadaceae bacterium]|nr:MAG: DUF1653 domain-containing protein [Comamonadaceae bacterium]